MTLVVARQSFDIFPVAMSYLSHVDSLLVGHLSGFVGGCAHVSIEDIGQHHECSRADDREQRDDGIRYVLVLRALRAVSRHV